MKEILLPQNKVAIIDDEDYELVSQYKWYPRKSGRNFYAGTNIPLRLHTLIMGKKQGFEIDHINHDGLDNRRCNLRHVTRSQNRHNCRSRLNTSSIYKGVCWHKRDKRWVAAITDNRIRYHLGSYTSEQEAALVYNKEAIKRFGEFAYINKINLGLQGNICKPKDR